MGLVLSDDGSSFSVHGSHVVFVPCVELIHLPDQVVSLVCEQPKVFLEAPLLSLRVESALLHNFQLVVQIFQSVAVTLVLGFQFLKLFIFAQ